MALLAYVVLGLLVALLCRVVLPVPRQLGLVSLLLLGMVGAIVGGALSTLFNPGALRHLTPLGLVLSTLGAVAVVVGVVVATRRQLHA